VTIEQVRTILLEIINNNPSSLFSFLTNSTNSTN
jgi:hypothetical protein